MLPPAINSLFFNILLIGLTIAWYSPIILSTIIAFGFPLFFTTTAFNFCLVLVFIFRVSAMFTNGIRV